MLIRNLPMRRKLALLILSATSLALVLACVGFAIYERASFRDATVSELVALADTLGANSAASLAFNDEETAREMLRALRTEHHVLGACLYDNHGRLFAEYRRADLGPDFKMPRSHEDGARFEQDSVTLFRSVSLNEDKTGSIAIVSDLRGFRDKLKEQVKIALLVLLVSVLATYLVSSRLLRIVSDPIAQLADIAGRVSAQEDYSLRAMVHGSDEVGKLVSSFNQMLARIQQRDMALQKANDELEERVRQRTAELEAEVIERQQAETNMRHARDAAEIANRAKSEFLANMSHEIRTPLNGVVGMTDLALDTELTSEQEEYLETVKLSADSLLTVINDILDFSKIEAGKIDLEAIDFNLRDCLEETLKTLALPADKKNLELLCEIPSAVPELVQGDSGRLRQVILNLVGNAIKFTHEGEVAIKVEIEREDRDIRTLHFCVTDTGIGIPDDKQQTIFDPFNQADTSTTRKYGGTGLGLAISARLVSMMGGRIWLESNLGRGSRFHFTVPLKALQQGPEPANAALAETLRGMKVLVVDDNGTNRRILQEILKKWEIRITDVEGGEQALMELVSAEEAGDPYHLILTDMHMPQMDGFELVERIRRRAGLSTVAIMMLTSAGYREDVERCRELGITSYLLKPIRKQELLSAILTSLGQRKAASQQATIAQQKRSAPRQGLRILLAEDNRVNQAVATSILEKMGHSLVVANNGKEALSLLTTRPFDLVFMDIQMPEMDGLTATAKIREGERQTQSHLPIIALTAHAMKGDRERCLEAGMDGYLSKPLNRKELETTIASVVGECAVAGLDAGAITQEKNALANSVVAWDSAPTLERLGGDEQLLREIVEIFLEEADKQLEVLRQAIANGSAEVIEMTAHSLKAELGYLGISKASEKARELEEMGRKHDLEGAPRVFAALETEIFGIVASMRHMNGKTLGVHVAAKSLGASQ